jgi:hypothetical protein
MTVAELIDILEGMDPDMEVRFASQPSWPFEYSISDIYPTENVVYLAEGEQIGYLPGEVASELGWG